MQVLVNIRKCGGTNEATRYEQIMVDISVGATIGDIAKLVADRLGVQKSSLTLILCGHQLADSTKLQTLSLGQQTALNVLIDYNKSLTMSATKSEEADPEDDQDRLSNGVDCLRSFQVFCKHCDCLQRGKLRVYCGECMSSLVIVKRDPTCWDDVLKIGSIKAECNECGKETSATFCFKCVNCDNAAVALKEVRGAQSVGCCLICDENLIKVVVMLDCHHQTCVDCFVLYIKNSLEKQQFRIIPPYGYTTTCSVYGCASCIADPHSYYLLGAKEYLHYQKEAAEKFLELQDDGIICPKANCRAGFFALFDGHERQITCPECACKFCTICHQDSCGCDGNADASQRTIERSCRRCPSCGVQTERSTGCAHMSCLQCGTQWCFICAKRWNDECQWNHWFD